MRGAPDDRGGEEPRCGNCDAFLRNKDLQVKLGFPQQGWCRASPPQLVQVMLQQSDNKVAPGFQGVFVPTASDCWCRQWQAKAAATPIIELEADHGARADPAA